MTGLISTLGVWNKFYTRASHRHPGEGTPSERSAGFSFEAPRSRFLRAPATSDGAGACHTTLSSRATGFFVTHAEMGGPGPSIQFGSPFFWFCSVFFFSRPGFFICTWGYVAVLSFVRCFFCVKGGSTVTAM